VDYSFHVIELPQYLHVKVCGTNDPQTIQRCLKDIAETCVSRNASAVLVEENFSGPSLYIAEIFGQVIKGSQNIGPIRCIAYVDVNPEHDFSRMQFAETVALNRGINIRVFNNVQEAEAWLVDVLRIQK
jgi:hypothetical protein